MSFKNRNKKMQKACEAVVLEIKTKELNKNPKLKSNGEWIKPKKTR